MIKECKICLTKYNDETVSFCPHCQYKRGMKNEKKQ